MAPIDTVRLWLVMITFILLQILVVTADEGSSHVMVQLVIVEYDNPGGTSYHGNDPTSNRKCCDGNDRNNCTMGDTCDTQCAICIGRISGETCHGLQLNLGTMPNTNTIRPENGFDLHVRHLRTWQHNDTGILSVSVHDVDTDVIPNTGSSLELIDRLSTNLSLIPDTNYWTAIPHRVLLQNHVRIVLTIKLFCESDYFGPDCAIYQPPLSNLVHTSHVEFMNGKTVNVLDCKQAGSAMIEINTTHPYFYTPSVLKTELAYFTANKLCLPSAKNVSVALLNVRYSRDTSILRVVFSGNCSQRRRDEPISTLMVKQVLSFMSDEEQKLYFNGTVVTTSAIQSIRKGHYQVFISINRYNNPRSSVWVKPPGFNTDYELRSCGGGGCRPFIQLDYMGTQNNISQSPVLTNDLEGCLNYLVPRGQHPNYTEIPHTFFFFSEQNWTDQKNMTIQIQHNNINAAYTIANFIIDPSTYHVRAGMSYQNVLPVVIPFTNAVTGVSIEVELMVWCSLGRTGIHCEHACPPEDPKCNLQNCKTDPSHKVPGYLCRNGDCINGTCQCHEGFAGTVCRTQINYCQLGDLPDRCVHGQCNNKVGGFDCICEPDYAGPLCDMNINQCDSNPCQHGTCVDHVNSFTCNCPEGYTGTLCDIDINECDSNPCQHGTCVDHVNSFTCNCTEGYTGTLCDNDINECDPNPCQRGTCVDHVNSFTCSCPEGYTGRLCDSDINECDSNPCQHGTCVDHVNSFTCNCPEGYTGPLCDIDINECDSNPCQHGTCVDHVNSFTCNCPEGYTGTLCDIDINECDSNPCQHGTCVDHVNSFTCSCPEGYTGRLCDSDINECDSNPCQYGTCVDHVNSFTCNCPEGYTGTLCDSDINECDPNPCQHGTCVDHVNSFTCNCPEGYTGRLCDSDINECDPNPCQHGTCVDHVNSFTCNCPEGYTGPLCDIDINECDSNPCQHGVCMDTVNNYTCVCSPGFSGRTCQLYINACESSPCHYGTCTDNTDGLYTCICHAGYTGDNCDVNIDDCRHDPCRHGTCFDGVAGYMCKCQSGFGGDDCDIPVPLNGPCDVGWTGMSCDVDVNECVTSPCHDNNTCINTPGSYFCDNNDCDSSPCRNGGVCLDLIGTFDCQCSGGFVGVFCEVNVLDLLGPGCKNRGVPHLVQGTIACLCPPAYTGSRCEILVDNCDPSPCQNGGSCENLPGTYTCYCSLGYGGLHCDEIVDPCRSQPCRNGGQCLANQTSYRCRCGRGYTGDRCEKHLIDPQIVG